MPIDPDLDATYGDPLSIDAAAPVDEVESDAVSAALLLENEASPTLVIEAPLDTGFIQLDASGIAIEGTNSGHVYEDGARPAIGQLTAANAGGAAVWTVETEPSAFGTLAIDATGRWTYTLKNEVPAVQDLAQGETITDRFTVRVSDGLTSAAEIVSVSIIGTNDFPFIPVGPLPATVIEGGVSTASGQLTAFDRDHAALLDWSLSTSLTGYSSDYRVEAERLVVIRNGLTIVDDSFSDGLIPTTSTTSHPGFALSGSFSEANGALVMDGARAAAATGVGDPDLGAVHVATLMTNIDPANTTAGLKRSHDFTIEATFDLTMPGAGQVYGLQLSDRFSGSSVNPALTQLGDDSPGLDVFVDAQGNLGVRLVERNFVTDVLSLLETRPIVGQHDQIVLRLTHDNEAVGVVHASFDLLDGGIVTQRIDFAEKGWVFGVDTEHTGDDEAWTRAQISASGRDPAPTTLRGVYGTMSIDAAGSWTYALDNDDPDTVALGAGQTAVEAFSARVTDQYGFSQRTQLNVSVVGAAEVLTVGGQFAGVVHEDGAATYTGLLSAGNAAPGPLTWAVTGANASYGGLNLDAITGQWTYQLNNASPLTQALAQGEQALDTFTVQVTDASGASATRDIRIDIAGTNDVPTAVSLDGPPAGTVTEDGQLSASGQLAGLDNDHGATFSWSVSRAPLGYSSDYFFTADHLSITRNGALIFNDGFDDGMAPPSSPGFTNGSFLSYGTSGFFSESGGRLVLDGAVANATLGIGTNALRVQNNAVLNTDQSPNLDFGLKNNDDLVIEARFDLAVPTAGAAYGVALSDRVSASQAGDDLVFLNVFNDGAGGIEVRFDQANIVTDRVESLASVRFAAPVGAEPAQIVLRLMHDADRPGDVTAALEVTRSGTTLLVHDFAATGHIFGSDTPGYASDDEVHTRVQISAFGPDVSGNTIAGTFGTLSIDATGAWTYTLNNDAANVQALAQGVSVTDVFQVRVVDQFGASSRIPVTVTIHGAGEDVALPIDGDKVGEVYEDGSLRAVGQLTSGNPAPSAMLAWHAASPQGIYGSLALDPMTGQWTYQLDNLLGATQALAQGEQAIDTFTVHVTDQSGASGTETLSITIHGSNDGPSAGSLGFPAGTVTEDGQQSASGQFFGIDVDHGATFSWSLSRAPLGYSSDYLFTADHLSIKRNGALIFSDGFDDGAAPPSSPGFTNGSFLSYGTSGLFSESGGRLVLDGAVANATLGIGTNALRVQNNAVLNTDQSPNLDFGLKIDDDIVVEARFDLTVPDAGEAYGITLSDRVSPNQAGDDLVFLMVHGDGQGGVSVRFDDASIVTDAVSLIEKFDFAAPALPAQIVLRLVHDNENPGLVRASFDVVSGGTTVLARQFLATGHIFGSDTPGYAGDDEIHTRVQISAFGADVNGNTLAGTYGTLAIDATGAWTYTLNNDAANVQALAQGMSVTDVFQVRVVDQFGASSRMPLTITISGADEPGGLTIGGEHAGQVYEDGARPAVGQLTVAGVTGGSPFWTVDSPSSQYGSLAIDTTGRWTYQLANDAQLVQDLAQGETIVDRFTVRAFDGPASASAVVEIAITGTNDFPGLSVPPPAGPPVVEDGLSTVSGQAFGFDRDHGAKLHWSASTSASGYSSDYLFLADRLKITRDGAVILDDQFDDGLVPTVSTPSHPGYALNGGFSEAGGFLLLDGSLATVATGAGTPELLAANLATLLTNTDPLNTVNGLKRHHDFSVELTYDLVTPAAGQGYSLTLSDRVSGGPLSSTKLGDDAVFLTVYGGALGGLEVRLEERNFVTDTLTVFETVHIGQHDQIVLRFTHDNAAGGVIHASFDLLDDGLVTQHVDMNQVVHIYGADTPAIGDDEVWTRVQLGAFGPDEDALVVQGVYGALSIDRLTGQWTYTLDNADPDTDALVAGQIASEVFQLRVIDEYGASSRAPLFITVLGSSPMSIAGDVDGEVYEDGSLHDSGQLVANGAVPGTLVWNAAAPQGTYGFLSLDPFSGHWTYQLTNGSILTQALAQGEQVVDTFSVQVTDAFGASSAATVSVTINGGNDAPAIVNVGPPGPIGTTVTEDALQTLSGHFAGFDIDHGAMLDWSLSRAPLGYSSDYLFSADQLSITRNGALIFSDGFDDGAAPPSSPGFTNGAFLDYGISGALSESGGRLLFDGAQANATLGIGTNVLRVQNNAVLNTNVTPDLAFGLKIDDDILLEARFDLAIPDAGEGYGITLSDRLNAGKAGDDLVFLMVHSDAAGGVRVRFDDTSIVTDTVSVLGAFDFAAPATPAQIVLRLMHDAERPGEVRAEFDVVSGGATILSHEFAATGHIFGSDTPGYAGDDEVFTRAQISAFGEDASGTTVAGTYGTLTVDGNGVWTYTLDNEAPHVQALAQGMSVTDTFQVRVVDEFGASSRAPLVFTINGTNDQPVIAPIADQVGAERGEISFVASATDVDLSAVPLTYSLLQGPDDATIDPLSGVFSWTPDERHGGATYDVTVLASDGLASAIQTVRISVAEDGILDAGRNAGDGSADVFRVVRSGENLEGYLGGDLVFSRPFASMTDGLRVEGSGDDDRLEVDFCGGEVIPLSGIRFIGGGPGDDDALALIGGAADTVVYHAFDAHSGTVSVDGAVIAYEGLEPIADTLAARQRTFVFGDDDDAITLQVGEASSSLSSPSSESVSFANPLETLTIEAGAGDDAIIVLHSGQQAPGFDLVIDGGSGVTALAVTGTEGDDQVAISDAGGVIVVTVNGAATALSGATSVTFDALGGDDVIDASAVTAATVELWGGAGNDRLIGGALADVLHGGAGDDVLAGGGGEDLLDGGEGSDSAELQRLTPIAYWNLNEVSGSGAADSAGTPQNGTLFGRNADHDDAGPTTALAPFGAQTGVELHGANGEYIAVAHDRAFEVAEGTIQLWFNSRDARERQALFAKDQEERGAGQLAIWLEEGDLKVKLETGEGSERIDTDGTAFNNLVQSNQWYQLTFTFGPQGMKLYVGGTLVGSNGYTGGLLANQAPIVIGGSNAENHRDSSDLSRLKITDAFDGWIDEVAFFGKALSVAEIAQTRTRGGMGVIGPQDAADVLIDIEQLVFFDAPGPIAAALAAPAAVPATLTESALSNVATFHGPAGVVEVGHFDGTLAASPAAAVEATPPLARTEGATRPIEPAAVEQAPQWSASEWDASPRPGIAVKVDWDAVASGFGAALSPYAAPPAPQPYVADFRWRRSEDPDA